MMWKMPNPRGLLVPTLLLLLMPHGPVMAQSQGDDSPEPEAEEVRDTIHDAYRREYAFLTAQKRDLEQRIQAFREQAGEEYAGLESEIESLQAAVVDLETEADRLENRLRALERQRQVADRNEELLESLYQQAGASFSEHRYEVGQAAEDGEVGAADRLQRIFTEAMSLIQRDSTLQSRPGSFFDRDGEKREGRIIRFGRIASYGISDEAAGILVPAGGGELKLWKEPKPEVARRLADGDLPERLPLFLHGNQSDPVDTADSDGVMATIGKGGTIAWLIVALATLALVLILARVVFLKRASASTDKIVESVSERIRAQDIEGAIERCRRLKGSTAAVVAAALRNLDRDREALDDIINEAILHESSHLERFGSFILVIAAVSPLLGLLGTVTGMISTFEVITEHGTGDPQLLSGGISVALITTELGLIVAIPTLLVGNLLSGWADRIKDDMHKAALRISNLYEETGRAN